MFVGVTLIIMVVAWAALGCFLIYGTTNRPLQRGFLISGIKFCGLVRKVPLLENNHMEYVL